jgi:F-type H+-transporting ATPase subunit b
VRTWILALPLWFFAVPALAAESEGGGFLGLPTLFWKTANLVVFFGLMFYLLARPLSRFFHARREQISAQMKGAAIHLQEAERLRAEMEEKMAALAGEIAELKERLRGEGEREREALERQGEEDAARLAAQFDHEASRRIDEARRQLASEAASVAAELALELLARELTGDDRERIFRATLDRLTARAATGGR